MAGPENKKFFEKSIKKVAAKYDMKSLLNLLNEVYTEQHWSNRGGQASDQYLPYGNQAVFIFRQPPHVELSEYIGCLSHEMSHATYHILDRLGVKYAKDDYSHEAFTYLPEFLMIHSLETILPKKK